MYALQHPRTRTLHTIYNFCTFYFYLDTVVYALTFITMFFILSFILINSHSHSSASWHTHSPSTLVTPDVGPPWPLRSRRLRSPRRSSRTQPHALLDHYLAPSNSLGHDVDFTWPRATRSATATSSPGHEHATRSATATRSLGLSNSPGLELNQQPSRSTSLDLDQSPIQPSAANSLRHRNDTASSVVSFLPLRIPHPLAHRLSSQDLHRSPVQARTLGQHALDKPAARVASTAGTNHLNTLSLEFAKFVTL